ncbi:MAG TPA: hypothetical protein VGY58_17990, partial [Gemmataceae bacterium]|nr:hypothetical protein [Gemmataceae bacterium]
GTDKLIAVVSDPLAVVLFQQLGQVAVRTPPSTGPEVGRWRARQGCPALAALVCSWTVGVKQSHHRGLAAGIQAFQRCDVSSPRFREEFIGNPAMARYFSPGRRNRTFSRQAEEPKKLVAKQLATCAQTSVGFALPIRELGGEVQR